MSGNRRRRSAGRPLTLGLALLLLAPGALTGAEPAGPPPVPATVDAAVTRQLAGTGTADVFVMLRDKANLGASVAGRSHTERVARGTELLAATAERTQAGVRGALSRRGQAFEAYWIVNAVLVRGAPADVVRELGARADVRRVRLAGERHIPKPITGTAAAADVDWNIDRIRAPQVWAQYGVFGQGVVVASIDTGAEFTHPAITRQYRGNLGGGVFDHNYNWYDPSHVCAQPAPCDNHGHGTHVTGTMTGDDGATNPIGVAPQAKWISAKGCETDACSDVALIRSGQWVMAPTDLAGNNPRPDLAPQVVNNSWGGLPGDDFYQDIVNAWTAVGIFPVFAAGNSGPGCNTAGSPGDYQNAYAVGAFDSSNSIAYFSSRGGSAFDGETKPNIAAPGAGIRSSVPGGGYESWSGTSMATPHVAGVVALMWSAAPALRGDVGLTRSILDQSAVDTADTSCGGTIADNNVWGEGRLDAYAAVERAPRGPTGVLTGVVTDAVTGLPLGGVSVSASSGGASRYAVSTAPDGTYRMLLSVGTYQVTYAKFAFFEAPRTVQVTQNGTTTVNVALAHAPRHTVTGVVRDVGGGPVRGVTVRLDGTPVPPSVTGIDGVYRFTEVPDGTYATSVTAAGCTAATLRQLLVDGDEFVDLPVTPRPDAAGYACQGTATEWVPGSQLLALTGDQALSTIATPFPFVFYGRTYTTVTVTTNGFLTFANAVFSSTNRPIPASPFPNAGLYPFWDDLVVDASAGIYTAVVGSAPNRRFVVEWRNAAFYGLPGRVTFEAVLSENGRVQFAYQALSAEAQARGASASVGVEDATGTIGLQYAYNEVALVPGATVVFRPPATVAGTVTDVESGQGVPDVVVSAQRDGAFVAQAITGGTGQYSIPLPAGTYALTYTKPGYVSGSATVTLTAEGEVVTRNVILTGSGKTVAGVVRDEHGNPAPGQLVRFSGPTVVQATTDDDGAYRIPNVPLGSYYVSVGSPCKFGRSWPALVVDGDESADYTVSTMFDDFGYQCRPVSAPYVDATDAVALTGDEAVANVALPFPFRLYGLQYTSAYVSTNGFLSFTDAVTGEFSDGFPTVQAPNAAVYALWQDLLLDGVSSVRTVVTGQAPNRRFVVEWRNALVEYTLDRVTMEIVLGEDGSVDIRMRDTGGSYRARTGLENAAGTVGFRYDDTFQPVRDGLVIRFTPPGQVQGVLRDLDDGTPVADGVVRGLRDGSTVKEVRTDAAGRYVLPLQPGDYTVEYAKGTAKTSAAVTVSGAGAVVTRDVALPLNTVTGTVTDAAGTPLPGVTVSFMNWSAFQSIETTTAADGSYRLDGVGDATHAVSFKPFGDGCLQSRTFDVVVNTDQVVNAALARYADGFGNTCRTEPLSWEPGTTTLALTGDDAVATVPLPFGFRFYGTPYSSVKVSTNGFVSFTDSVAAPVMSWLPATEAPNAAVYALWSDLLVDASSSVRTSVLGTGTNRRVVIEWRDVLDKWSNARNTFSITLYENGQISVSYQTVVVYLANVGIEDPTGARFLQYENSINGAHARSGVTIRFVPPTP